MDKLLSLLQALRPEEDFLASRDFLADGLLDSFDLITLVSDLDQAYGIRIDGTDILPEHFTNVDSLAALVRKYGGTP